MRNKKKWCLRYSDKLLKKIKEYNRLSSIYQGRVNYYRMHYPENIGAIMLNNKRSLKYINKSIRLLEHRQEVLEYIKKECDRILRNAA